MLRLDSLDRGFGSLAPVGGGLVCQLEHRDRHRLRGGHLSPRSLDPIPTSHRNGVCSLDLSDRDDGLGLSRQFSARWQPERGGSKPSSPFGLSRLVQPTGSAAGWSGLPVEPVGERADVELCCLGFQCPAREWARSAYHGGACRRRTVSADGTNRALRSRAPSLSKEQSLIVVHHLIVGRSVFTVWLLEELGLEYELETYRRLDTGRAPKSLKAIHPLGKSPVIVDQGRVIAESGAITSYLLQRYDREFRLSPKPSSLEAWTRFIQWLHYPEGSAFAPMLLVLLQRASGERAPESIASFASGEVQLHLDYMSEGLGNGRFILGPEFSAADVGVAYVCSLAERLQLLEGRPILSSYLERIRARPAFRRAWERSGG